MQLYREITEYRAGEGESYIEIRQDGKRCTVIEKIIGRSQRRQDIDANGAAYLIVQRMDGIGRRSQWQTSELGLDREGRDEPHVHPKIQAVFNENKRAIWSPLAAQVVWNMCHPTREAA